MSIRFAVLTGVIGVGLLSLSTYAIADQHEHKGGFFAKGDTNGDGKISKDEFQKNSLERFQKMDGDGDGFVTQDEMKSAFKAMHEKRREKHGGKYKDMDGKGHQCKRHKSGDYNLNSE